MIPLVILAYLLLYCTEEDLYCNWLMGTLFVASQQLLYTCNILMWWQSRVYTHLVTFTQDRMSNWMRWWQDFPKCLKAWSLYMDMKLHHYKWWLYVMIVPERSICCIQVQPWARYLAVLSPSFGQAARKTFMRSWQLKASTCIQESVSSYEGEGNEKEWRTTFNTSVPHNH